MNVVMICNALKTDSTLFCYDMIRKSEIYIEIMNFKFISVVTQMIFTNRMRFQIQLFKRTFSVSRFHRHENNSEI